MSKTNDELKELVKTKYTEIAEQNKEVNMSSCCGSGSCSTEIYNIMSDDYHNLEGYVKDADLGLGCGLPTQFAKIKKGDFVIDLGSGAGNDCFVARKECGETGKVIGIDFTPKMIEKARENAEKLNYNNVEFRLGDIEKIPVTSNFADVVVSNCVLNLVPEKEQVFKEIFRVLKTKGHFSISDVVLVRKLPKELTEAAEMYAGCVSGAIEKDEYIRFIKQAGFVNVTIQSEKDIKIPNDILSDYLNNDEISKLYTNSSPIKSITVYAEKPESCCSSSDKCC